MNWYWANEFNSQWKLHDDIRFALSMFKTERKSSIKTSEYDIFRLNWLELLLIDMMESEGDDCIREYFWWNLFVYAHTSRR